MSAVPASVLTPTTLSQAVAAPPIDYGAKMVDTQRAGEQVQQQYDAARAPAADAVKTASDDLTRASNAPEAKVPVPMDQARHMDPKQLNEAASLFMTLGALAGALTRTPMTAALNNMTAAIQGVQAGDAEQYDKAHKEFESNYKRAMDQNKSALDEKEKVMKDKNLTLTARMNELKLIDAKYGNEVGRNTKTFAEYSKLYDGQQKATAKVEAAKVAMDAKDQQLRESHATQIEIAKMRTDTTRAMHAAAGTGGAIEPLSPQALKLAAELTEKGIPLPGGYSKAGMSRGNAILNQMAEGGATGGSIASGRADVKADTGSLAFQQKRVDAVEAGAKKIASDIKTIDTYIKEGNPDHIRLINQGENQLRSLMSDPTLAPYALAVKQVATEYERQMQGGQMSVAQLHAGAQEQARKILNEDMSVAEVRSVLPVMLRELENNRVAAHSQLGEIRTRMGGSGATAAQPYSDTDKERRYQEWKAKQGAR